MRSLHAVPVNEHGFAREGLQAILEQLQAGRVVSVFPEGHRTQDGQMSPFRPGILLLIKRLAIPIVPIGIAGAFDAWPRLQSYPTPAPLFLPARKGTIAVSVGPPIDSRCFAGQPREKVLAELFVEVQKQKERAHSAYVANLNGDYLQDFRVVRQAAPRSAVSRPRADSIVSAPSRSAARSSIPDKPLDVPAFRTAW